MTYIDRTQNSAASLFSARGARAAKAATFDTPDHSSTSGQPGFALNSDSGSSSKLSGALWSLQSGTDDGIDQAPDKTPEQEFSELADMDLGDRMMQQYLGEHGLSKEDFANLPAEEREKIIEEVRRKVLEQSKSQQLQAKASGTENVVQGLGASSGSDQAGLSDSEGRRKHKD
ncbi:hypothetical protein [Rhizobium sp. BE258]|uniref:hypothetical protein n=1 Tax=Rhizobium sp. BE258 TaxID=2817722 RepID=UPI000DD6FED8|nr:hypothetical protein [Rhizobium sp. BE258]MDR7145030.1 hypothetical protein [Rhizobium sp. BE258]